MDDHVRTLILRVGEQALREHGFFGVSVRGIAREVGVPPGTIGYYFGGKQGLLSAILLAAENQSP